MKEFGIFNDAGCLEAQLYNRDEAARALLDLVAAGEPAADLRVLPVCPDHEEQPEDSCEDCEAENGELEETNR